MWILIFIIQKPIFMIRYHSLMSDCGTSDFLKVIWHGLTLDLSMAGYLTAVPALILITSIWIVGKWMRQVMKIYFIVASILVSMTFIVNLELYDFWGFPLDATPLFYFLSLQAHLNSIFSWIPASAGMTSVEIEIAVSNSL